MDAQRRVDQRRVHPQQQVGVVGVVALAAHRAVGRLHFLGGTTRLLVRAEDDGEAGVEGALQAGERIGFEPAVLGHAPGHQGMGQLHEQGSWAPEQQDELAVDATDHGVVVEEPAGHQKSSGMMPPKAAAARHGRSSCMRPVDSRPSVSMIT